MPYSLNNNNGSFDGNALSGTFNQNSFYQNASYVAHSLHPFAESVFETSPLNRVTVQGAAGDPWQISTTHTTKIEYGTNAANEVLQWVVNSPTNAFFFQSYFPGSLFKKILTDEEGKQSFEYTDKLGRLIAKSKNVFVLNSLSTFRDRHVKFLAGQKGTDLFFTAIGFDQIEHHERLMDGCNFSMAYTLEDSVFNGSTSLQLRIKDIKFL